jgi:hypothetical protein
MLCCISRRLSLVAHGGGDGRRPLVNFFDSAMEGDPKPTPKEDALKPLLTKVPAPAARLKEVQPITLQK